jgi:GntR family transcriptional regulator of gluconate operon
MQEIGALERSNLAESVAGLLRESIAVGRIPSGSRLVEAEIAKQLNVSRGPVREAFRILETEGLLQSRPGRGSFVTQTSERDIREVYSLRCVLEEEAFRLAVQKRGDEDIFRLEQTLEAMFAAAKDGDHAKVLELDLEFHRQIWDIADHYRLQNMLKELATQVRMYIAVQTKIYDDLAAGVADHQILLDAIRDRDEKVGTRTLRKHLQLAADMVSDYFKTYQSGDVNEIDL